MTNYQTTTESVSLESTKRTSMRQYCRNVFLASAAATALAVVGTGAAFAYRTYVGSPRIGEPPIIRAACPRVACPSQAASAVDGSTTPTRIKPPAMPASSDSATSTRNRGRAATAAIDGACFWRNGERAITNP